MKRQEYLIAIVCTAVLFCMPGCMSIKDTSGIKKYLGDQGEAEMLAIEIKANNPDKNSSAYRNTERLYNKAAGAGNGWTSGIVLDARNKQEVDVSVEDYKNSSAGKALSEFLALDSSFKTKSFDPVTAAALVTFVTDSIERVGKLNDQFVERAVKRLEHEFSRSRWTTFEKTTSEWIDEKYKFKSSGD